MQTAYDAIVIGGGPAGCAAAAFICRCRWSAAVVDRSQSGSFLGSLRNVSYFPGFADAISGQDLLSRMRRQAEHFGAAFVSDEVTAIEGSSGSFTVKASSDKALSAKAIVIATGAASRTNYLQGEREFLGRGVYYDVQADGPAVAKRSAAIIGKSRHAVEEAFALTRFADRIHFIIPSNKLDADDAAMESLQRNRAIEMHFSTSLKKINGEENVRSITVFSGGQEKDIEVVGVFTYVHDHRAATGFLSGVVELAQNGAVKVDRDLATTAEGIFACGDSLCGRPQLPAIASSQGLLAGISVDRHLTGKKL
jgi:thioredoxin reductase (NADPH)